MVRFHHLGIFSSFIIMTACNGEPAEDSGIEESAEYYFRTTVTNGVTDVGIPDMEACVEIPAGSTPVCATTNADGVVEQTWSEDDVTMGNSLIVISGEGYWTTVNMGRVNENVLANWDEQMAANGVIELSQPVVSEVLLNAAIADTGITPEAGTGHAVVLLTTPDDTSLAGGTVTVLDSNGAAIENLAYGDESGLTFDLSLTATSASGAFGAFNLAPGEYSMSVDLDEATCSGQFSWDANTDGSFPLVVQADSVTGASLSCSAE